MPEILVKFLILVFIVHFIAFAWLAYKRREKRYVLVSTTFLLLIGSFSSRLWFHNVRVFSIPLHWALRISAWGFALVAVGMLIVEKFFKPKKERKELELPTSPESPTS